MSNFRRKIMMHEEKGDPWLKILLTMGCVFYAPLNKEGDLTDHVTGIVGYPYSFSSYSMPSDNLIWNEQNKAYLLHAKYGGQNAIIFPITNLADRIPGNNTTNIVTVKKANLNKFCYAFDIGRCNGNPSTEGWSLSHWYNRITLSSQKFITLTATIDYDNLIIKLYIDGQLYKTFNDASTYNGYKPNWKSKWYNYITLNGIGGCDQSISVYEGQAYFKECALFNKALTQEEIQIIINHNNN